MISYHLCRILYRLFFFNSSFFSESLIEDIADVSETIQPFSGSMKTEFFKMGLSLLGLLLVFTLCVWTFKKFMRRGSGRLNRSGSTIKILDQRALSHKSVLYLVQVVDKTLIIAESSEQIKMLSEFPPNTDLNVVMSEITSKKSTKSSSGDFLAKTIGMLSKKLS